MHAKIGIHGYIGLTRDNLIDDILGNRGSYDARQVVDGALPHILGSPGYVPVHKYLRAIGALDASGAIEKSANVSPKIEKMAERIRSGLPASTEIAKKAPGILANIKSIADLEAARGQEGVIYYGTSMPEDKVNPGELRGFLNTNQHLRCENWSKTQYIKLVCFLDWLENGRTSAI